MSSAPKPGHEKASKFKPDQMEYYDRDELVQLDYRRVPEKNWMDEPADIRHAVERFHDLND